MEISFWYLAVLACLVTWTMCTFLRAVAARTKQLREQIEKHLAAAKQAEEEAASQDVTTVVAGEAPQVATVISRPDAPNAVQAGQARRPSTATAGTSRGRDNGHSAASASGPAQ